MIAVRDICFAAKVHDLGDVTGGSVLNPSLIDNLHTIVATGSGATGEAWACLVNRCGIKRKLRQVGSSIVVQRDRSQELALVMSWTNS